MLIIVEYSFTQAPEYKFNHLSRVEIILPLFMVTPGNWRDSAREPDIYENLS